MKIYFQTHGCSTNQSESEVMAGLLSKAGFNIVNNIEDSNIIILNICTVKGEETGLREIRKITGSYPKKKLILAGCIPKYMLKEIRKLTEDASIITTHNIDQIVEVVEETINDNVVEVMAKDNNAKIGMPKVRKNNIIGIVPILSGCLGNCSYCSVRLIKGPLISYPESLIIKEIMQALDEGCKEIWVTSQDNAVYGMDKEETSQLPKLLKRILDINMDFKVRIGMMNPEHVLPIVDDLIEIYKHPKIFKFLHIPAQSGNDTILESMNRKYNTLQFKSIVERFREKIPEISISTDIIVGYPGETEEQFNDSLTLIKGIKPDVLNLSRFQQRPLTKAAHMDNQIDGGTIKDRSRLLTDIFNNISRMNNEKWLNWNGKVLIDEVGKDESMIARNDSYKPIVLKTTAKLGETVKVKIGQATPYDLRGIVL